MNIYKWMVLAALALAVALPFTRQVVAGEFADTLDTPALHSNLAAQGPLTGLASAGERLVVVGQRGHILYSDDAGQRWQQAEVPVSSDLVAVHFPSASQGWAVGHDGVVLHSADAGTTWTRLFDGRQIGPRMLAHYQAMAAAEPQNEAIAALVAEAQRMTEEGADKPFLDVWFENERVGYVVGAFNLIFRTDDGGRSWTPWMERTENPGALNLYGLRAVGDDLYIVGEQGLVLKLDAASGRFKAVVTPYEGSYFGVIGKPGMALVYGLRGNLYRSLDRGANWHKVELGLPVSIVAATLDSAGRVVLLSQAGHVLVSTDDGASFAVQPQDTLAPASAVLASGDSLVLVGTRGVHLLPLQ
ncbi:YCF48-related protein [Pseudomonas sp. LFM046]|uniref:WD40/YVTN/BNR-like repeat-containing protein n=1 Tax=Pseudomonas sp. LFM046 TaxID=1608357 RepID=UPI0005CFB3A0|nr:YCF48-related protein [Pseudomonas sp. LFM046]